MSFPAYSQYKDTGLQWLGEVPAHWDVARFRHHFRESPEKIEDEVVGVMLSVSGYRGIEIKEYDDENRRRLDEELVNYRIVRKGQLVVNSMWLNAAGLGVSAFEGHVSPAYRCYWVGDRFNLRYAHHLLRSGMYVDGYTSMVQGIRPNSLQLSRTDLMNLPVLIPLPPEQQAVAQFLDRETAKIDGLVAEQRRLIALLQEKRQALISHAVTKGLDPTAPLKPTGIDWLGDVPAHWEEYPLKALLSLKHGYAFDGAAFSPDGESILMTPGNFCERGGFRSKSPEKYYAGGDIPEEFVLQCGQLLVAMTEQAPGLLGSALFVPDHGVYLHNQRIGLVDRLRRDLLNERFLFHLFNSSRYRAEVSVTSSGAKVKHTSPQRMLSVKVCLPPLAEQEQIANVVDEKIAKIDDLQEEAEQAISLLHERRTALISAAVTGKIDLRDLANTEAVA